MTQDEWNRFWELFNSQWGACLSSPDYHKGNWDSMQNMLQVMQNCDSVENEKSNEITKLKTQLIAVKKGWLDQACRDSAEIVRLEQIILELGEKDE